MDKFARKLAVGSFAELALDYLVEHSIETELVAESCNLVGIEFVGNRIALILYRSSEDNSVVVARTGFDTVEIPC